MDGSLPAGKERKEGREGGMEGGRKGGRNGFRKVKAK